MHILDEYGRHIDEYWNIDNDGMLEEDPVKILIVRIIKHNDESSFHEDFKVAKQKEINGLMKSKIWLPVSTADDPKSSNVLGGIFLLSLNNLIPLMNRRK